MQIESRHMVSVLEGDARLLDKVIFCVVMNAVGSVLSIRGMDANNADVELGTITTSGTLFISKTFTVDLEKIPVTCVWYKITSCQHIVDLCSATIVSKTGAPIILVT